MGSPSETIQNALEQGVSTQPATGVASIGRSGLSRWLTPSFFDCLFLSVLVWLFAVGDGGWTRLLMDGDTGWHIRTGEWILDHGAVPRADPFSFSKFGQPWFAWEWLCDVVYALLLRVAGLKGIVLLSGIVFAAFSAVLCRHMVWRGANLFIALPLVLIGTGAATVHVLARPHLWTLLFVAITTWMIQADLRRPSRKIWLLVPVTILWTNMHGGFLALIACLGLTVIGTGLEAIGRRRDWTASKRYMLVGAACGLASLVNPYGWELHLHVAKYLQSDWIREVVQEFQSPTFRSENMMQFELILLAGLTITGLMIARGKYVDALWVLFWAHSTLGSVRHAPIFVAVALPALGEELARLWAWWSKDAPRSSTAYALDTIARESQPSLSRTSVWAVIPLVALACIGSPTINWPDNFPKELFPTALIEKHGQLLSGSRVFASDQWSDYLIYRFYPQQRVFFDGRSDFYGPALGKEYIRISQGGHDWSALLEKHGIDVVLSRPDWPLASLLKQSQAWKLVEDSGKALLFVRRTPLAGISVRSTSGA